MFMFLRVVIIMRIVENIHLYAVIWYPFYKAHERQMVAEENAAE